ncbi:hypothetical protein FB451DRAFT_1370653 [Mycena latifolia]|nr:hypothetical protein FB451DRAFT_1370653 [Mycena latifolia]
MEPFDYPWNAAPWICEIHVRPATLPRGGSIPCLSRPTELGSTDIRRFSSPLAVIPAAIIIIILGLTQRSLKSTPYSPGFSSASSPWVDQLDFASCRLPVFTSIPLRWALHFAQVRAEPRLTWVTSYRYIGHFDLGSIGYALFTQSSPAERDVPGLAWPGPGYLRGLDLNCLRTSSSGLFSSICNASDKD